MIKLRSIENNIFITDLYVLYVLFQGDYVLCVQEETKISQYIINRMTSWSTGQIQYKIGDQVFDDIPSILRVSWLVRGDDRYRYGVVKKKFAITENKAGYTAKDAPSLRTYHLRK